MRILQVRFICLNTILKNLRKGKQYKLLQNDFSVILCDVYEKNTFIQNRSIRLALSFTVYALTESTDLLV